jgi:hypothetical protein
MDAGARASTVGALAGAGRAVADESHLLSDRDMPSISSRRERDAQEKSGRKF